MRVDRRRKDRYGRIARYGRVAASDAPAPALARENSRGKSMITEYMAVSSASLIIIADPDPLGPTTAGQAFPCSERPLEWLISRNMRTKR